MAKLLSHVLSSCFTLQLRNIDNELAALNWQRELTSGQKFNMADKHLHPHLCQLVESRAELQQTATQLAQQTAYRPQPSQVASQTRSSLLQVLQCHVAVVCGWCDLELACVAVWPAGEGV